MHSTREESSSERALRQILRRRWLVLACALSAVALAVVASAIQEKRYSASASLLFRDPRFDERLFGTAFIAPQRDPAREAATNVRLVSSEEVAKRTARTLGGGVTAQQVSDSIEVGAEGQSDLVSVTATDTDPKFAARLANTFGREFVRFRQESDRQTIQSAQRLVEDELKSRTPDERNGPAGRSLRQRAEELQVFASLQTGNAELVQPADVPRSPSSPRPLRNGVVAGLVGALIGCILALLFGRLDRRFRDPEEIQEAFDRPVLAVIPHSGALEDAGTSSPVRLPAVEAEAFRMLRANLRYFNVGRDISSVLVASAAPSEGKSTVALNLASVAADAGSKVLLIEADLRHPSLTRKLHGDTNAGLSNVLANDLALSEAVRAIPVGGAANGNGSAKTFDVAFAGTLPPNPTDLLESDRMERLIREAEQDYDLVIVDTPPMSVVSDAVPLVGRVSAVIVVSRLGQSTEHAARRLREQLERLNAPVLGLVVNDMAKREAPSYYTYGYTEQEQKSEQERPVAAR